MIQRWIKALAASAVLLYVFSPVYIFGATEFVVTLKSSSGDFTSLHSAQSTLANDITVSTIKVFSISATTTPPIAAGDSVTGLTSGATGTLVWLNAAHTQVLIKSISGTFQNAENVKKTSDAS